MSNTRQYTNKLLEMIDNGVLDHKQVVEAFCCYCPESDVADMMKSNEMLATCEECGCQLDIGESVTCEDCTKEECETCGVKLDDTEDEEFHTASILNAVRQANSLIRETLAKE